MSSRRRREISTGSAGSDRIARTRILASAQRRNRYGLDHHQHRPAAEKSSDDRQRHLRLRGWSLPPYLISAPRGRRASQGSSLEPRPGNPSPRIYEIPAGMLNAIGLAERASTPSFATSCRCRAPPAPPSSPTCWAAASRSTSRRLLAGRRDGLAALELNVSPAPPAGGIHFATDPRPDRPGDRSGPPGRRRLPDRQALAQCHRHRRSPAPATPCYRPAVNTFVGIAYIDARPCGRASPT